MLVGNPTKAVDVLSLASKLENDKLLVSDLAAAHLTLSAASASPEQLVMALNLVEQAIEGSSGEARRALLFNRALTFEKLGLLRAAREAWELYLETEEDPAWGQEALDRISRIDNEFRTSALPENVCDRGAEPLHLAERQDAGLVRQICLEPLMLEWSQAQLEGNDDLARQTSGHWQELGRAITAGGGDPTVLDVALGVISSQSSPSQRAIDYQSFVRARELEADGRYLEARALFERLHASSSIEPVLRYWSLIALGGIHLSHARFEESERLLRGLLSNNDTERYPAIRAKAHWFLGLAAARRGFYGVALEAFENAEKIYAVTNEPHNEASIWMMQADLLRILGADDRAWRTRARVLARLGKRPASKFLHNQLWEAGLACARMGLLNAARAFNLEDVRTTESLGEHLLRAEAHYRLADTERELNLVQSATSSLLRAREASAGIVDPGRRSKSESSILAAEARLLALSDPLAATAKLQEAIGYLDATQQELFLPGTYAARARLNERLLAPESSLEDLYGATTLLSQQRGRLGSGPLRSQFLEVSQSVFDRLVWALAVEHDSHRRALIELESARSLESPDRSTRPAAALETLASILESETAVVTYFVGESSILTWRVWRGEIEQVGEPLPAPAIERAVAELSRSVREGGSQGEVEEMASLLFDALIKPALDGVAPSTSLIFVPDRFLQNVPFSLLRDRASGSYLVETNAHSVAPTLTSLLRSLRRGAPRMSEATPILVVTDPSGRNGDVGPLGGLKHARRTGEVLATLYRQGVHLTGPDATLGSLRSQLPGKKALHLGLHAVDGGARWPEPALVLAHERYEEQYARVTDLGLADSTLELVILAACSSSVASDLRSRTLSGLAREMGGSGSRSVIGALWPVDDEGAAELFQRLHRHLLERPGLAEAVRRAQADLLDSGFSARDWAAIQLLL